MLQRPQARSAFSIEFVLNPKPALLTRFYWISSTFSTEIKNLVLAIEYSVFQNKQNKAHYFSKALFNTQINMFNQNGKQNQLNSME
jgi:hypothetical protein